MRAQMAELVYKCAAANNGIVIDLDFAGKLCGVGDDDIVADNAIVRHVRICHDETVVAYYSFIFRGSTAVDGNTFADGCIIADNSNGVFASELQILRNGSDYGSREYCTVAAYPCAFEYGDIAADTGSLANFDIAVNCNKRVDDDSRCDLGCGVYIS